MTTSIDVSTDVSDAVGLGEPLQTRATVTLPDPGSVPDRPVVCFGFPGGGYSRQYFTFDMPGSSGGGEAGWHAQRGWVFVGVDHPCVGESTVPSEPERLTFSNVAAANAATVAQIRDSLVDGSLDGDVPALRDPVVLGIGQSMGGCFTIVQQGLHATYAGIGVLGFSARHTTLAFPAMSGTVDNPFAVREDGLPHITWVFHYDDVPGHIVAEDMRDYPTRAGNTPVWGSATMPPCATAMLDPGVIAAEAAAVTTPVFVGVGERDVCPDPRAEPEAYANSSDITVFVCPRMSHMHNFAGTRELFWSRLHAWGEGVAQLSE